LTSRLLENEPGIAVARWALTKGPRYLIEEVTRQVARMRGGSALDIILDHLLALLDPQPKALDSEGELDAVPIAAGGAA
jgi:hypothetical protein